MGLFTNDEVWTGGFYELALEYGRSPDPELANGLRTLWAIHELEGCYLDSNCEPEDQSRLQFQPSLIDHGHLYGVASLPGGTRVACGTCTVREDRGSDWLVFYCPMSALGRAYPVGGFPFDDVDHEHWRISIETWLADVARRVFDRVPFRLGLIGFETSGLFHADELSRSGVPSERHFGFLMPTEGKLDYHARTEQGT
jgi:hypothetical protein